MKKMNLMIAAALCLTVLAACGKPTGTDSSSGGVSVQPSETPTMAPEYILSDTEYSHDYYSEDEKTLLGTLKYTLPQLACKLGDEDAAAVTDAFNSHIEEQKTEIQTYWESQIEMAADYVDTSGDLPPYSDEVTYEVQQTDRILSLRYTHYVYTGGAHGYAFYTSDLFDLQNGWFVTLEEITDRPEELQSAVAAEIMRQIDEKDLISGYWDDYQTTVEKWMSGYSLYFTDEGMEIVFPAYDLAAYAAGVQTFVIDKEIYGEYLNEYGKGLLGIA